MAVCVLLKNSAMETRGSEIIFACAQCATSFVVDAAAAGMTLNCQNCGQPTLVPAAAPAPAPQATEPAPAISSGQRADLERRLKENESQRTEVTGYINQLCIQLHRWKLRLQTLNERKEELDTELTGLPR